jgi:hypothetical protein
MAAVYESLTPHAGRELSVADSKTLEIKRAYEAKTIRECASMQHDRRLDEADLAEATITWYRISVGVEEYTVRTELDGG